MTTLEKFVDRWMGDYLARRKEIPMYKPDVTGQWSSRQRQEFALLFQQIRGGDFIRFLFSAGANSCDPTWKQVVLDNLRDELGLGADPPEESHDRLYDRFCYAVGVDRPTLADEKVYQHHKRPFIDAYLRHNAALLEMGSPGAPLEPALISAHAAFEGFDNPDYKGLLKLAESFGLPEDTLEFFAIHTQVLHFEEAGDHLEQAWDAHPQVVTDILNRAKTAQITMWSELSAEVGRVHTPIAAIAA